MGKEGIKDESADGFGEEPDENQFKAMDTAIAKFDKRHEAKEQESRGGRKMKSRKSKK